MVDDGAGRDLVPCSMEKFFRPLPTGVQQLLLSSDSWPVLADSGSDPRGGDSPDKRTVRGDEEGNGHPGGIPLTPEERIVELLERNEGRMKQQEIAAAVDYSESTVSRKLCEMEAEEVVTRFRIGREKVVFLPGAVPAFFDSPLGRMGAD